MSLLLLLTPNPNVSSKLYLRSTQSNGIGATYYDLDIVAGSAVDTAVVNTVLNGTEVQFTKTAGGSIAQFISGRAPVGGFTLTSTDISLWLSQSSLLNNAGGRYRIFKRTAAGVESDITGTPFDNGIEVTASNAEYTWSGDVTDTAFAEDDRVLLKVYVTNIGVMAMGTATLNFNAADGLAGDSFLTVYPNAVFKANGGSPVTLSPSLFTDADTFYSATLISSINLAPALVTDADTFFSATLAASINLSPALFSDTDTFYTHSLTAGAVTLTPALYTDVDVFYSASISQGGSTQTLTAALFTDADVFYAASISAAITLTPSLYVDADTFYAAAIAAGAINLSPTRFDSSNIFYGATALSLTSLQPSLFSDADTFYSHVLTLGAVNLQPALFIDGDTFYSASIFDGLLQLSDAAIFMRRRRR